MRLRFPSAHIKAIVGVSLFMSAILLAFVAQKPILLVAGAFVCAAYAVSKSFPLRISSNQLLLLACISLLFLPGFLNPYHGFSPIFYFFSTFAAFFAAGAATKHTPAVLLAAFRFIYTWAVVTISYILYVYWDAPEPFGMAIEGSSTNGIPSYLIVIQIGLSLCYYLVHKRFPVLPSMITGAVAFFGNGRGSLVVAGLIIIASLIFNLMLLGSKNRKSQIFFIFTLVALAIPLAWNAEVLIDLLISYTKLSVGLADENRLEILDHYLGKINPITLLIGADYSGTVIESWYLGNPHIAYIRTHSFYGLPLTVLALVSPAFVFFSRKTLIAKVVFGCFIGLAAMRAVSEPIFFPTLLDFFYFSYFFLFFRYAPTVTTKSMDQSRLVVRV